jgi:hypothetical protein
MVSLMTKIARSYRLEPKIIQALEELSKDSVSMANTLEILIFRESMYKLNAEQLHTLYGDDYERLMLMYAVYK